jgi:hypothetical protein
MRAISSAVLSASFALSASAGVAHAAPDLKIDYTHVQIESSGPSGDTGIVSVPMTFNYAYSQQNPFKIACDSTFFSAGVAYGYANTGPGVYPELTGKFYLNGDEHQPIVSHGFGNTVPGGFDHANAPDNNLLLSPGQTFSEGFIGWNNTIPYWQYGFQPTDLPANVPVKFFLVVQGYSCTTWDYADGGYSPACRLPDAVPWNNAVNIWLVRECP